MSPTRRQFLAGSSAFMGAAALGLNTEALAQALRDQGHPPTLVTIYLRGGADPLNAIVPAGDPEYYKVRPTIGIAARSDDPENPGVIPVSNLFGLHPSLKPLHELYEQDRVAGIMCAGSTHPTRSHFDAQDYMESGTPGIKGTRDGWLNRYLQAHRDEHASVWQKGVGIDASTRAVWPHPGALEDGRCLTRSGRAHPASSSPRRGSARARGSSRPRSRS